MLFFCFYGIVFLNILTFVLFALDKRKAVKSRWRIPETMLIALSILGGSIGALMAMSLFRHKTQNKYFRIGIPVILVLQLIFVFWFYAGIIAAT